MARKPNQRQMLEALAVNPVPMPFTAHLKAIFAITKQMQCEAAKLGIDRKFTPDGRFMGDIGEVIVHLGFGVKLHCTQQEGQDGTCSVSGKCVEVKLRSGNSPVWVKQLPDILVAIYLSPETLQWGVVCNGPGKDLIDPSEWNDKHSRFETTLARLLDRQKRLPSNVPCLEQRK